MHAGRRVDLEQMEEVKRSQNGGNEVGCLKGCWRGT